MILPAPDGEIRASAIRVDDDQARHGTLEIPIERCEKRLQCPQLKWMILGQKTEDAAIL